MELLAVVVAAALALAVVWRLRGRLEAGPRQVRRALAAVAPTPPTALAAGARHRFDGVARAVFEPAPSPATGRPHLAYDVWISAFPGDSPSRRTAQGADDLLVVNAGVVVLVRGEGATVGIERDVEAPETTLDQVPEVDRLLRSLGVGIGSPSTCRVRMTEGIIAPGDPVAVLGHVEEADEEAAALGAAFVMRATRDQPLLIGRP